MEGNKPPVIANEKNKFEDNSSFNLKWLVSTVLAIWPFLLASVTIALIIANLYLRYTTPIFRSSAELLIIDSKKGSTTSGDDIMKMLNINTKNINLENEIEILKSRATVAKVVKRLHLNVNYSIIGRFKTTNVYNNKPFEFCLADTTDDYYSCKIENIGVNGYSLMHGGNPPINAKWGDTVTIPSGRKFLLNKTAMFSPTNIQYTIGVQPVIATANGYMYKVDVSSNVKSASYVTISMSDAIPERSIDIINDLMRVYMSSNVETRNRISDSTIHFIEQRIDAVALELSGVEKQIKEYKQANNIADMSAQAELLVNTNAATLEKLHVAEIEYNIVEAISSYLQKATDDKSIILPASLMSNSGLAALMDKFNALQTQIENSEISNTRTNPITVNLINQKKAVKQNIISSLASSRDEMKLKVDKIKSELTTIDAKVNKIPVVEKAYLEFARMQSIKQDMYIFLLKKREETATGQASVESFIR